jgi:hypothetical protein
MQINQYLIISPGKKRLNPNVKLVKSLKGQMPSNAVALKLNIQIPDSIFQRPQLEASIKINEEDVSKPMINAAVLDNIKEAFQQQLGVDVNIQHVQPDLELANYNVEMKEYLKKKK